MTLGTAGAIVVFAKAPEVGRVKTRLAPPFSLEQAAAVLPGLAERVIWLSMPRVEISASEIRRRVKDGRPIRYLVPDAVEAYIREQGLYS